MLTPTVANSISFFYPVGNTPAVNLARGLPQGIDGDLLLLGCGDVRNILHTAYNEIALPGRKFDITCNDWDEAILARNILFFSFLLDNKGSGNTPWNLYYELHLSKSDLDQLSNQLTKLLAASESLKSWKSSAYGKVLPFVDQDTFDDVRAIWKSYHASVSVDVAVNSAALRANLKHSMELKELAYGQCTQTLTGMRSAAPIAMPNFRDIMEASDTFWKSGLAGSSGSATVPNPMFAAALSKHRVLHYATDPILGFHLASAFASLTDSSPLKPDQKDDKLKAYAAAKTQFREWAAACGKLFREKKLVVRSVASEGLAFCQTLQHFVSTKETSAGWYRRQFDHRALALDPDAYGGKLAAPSSFDAIDTSNIADYVGTLNLLTSALPLLKAHPWSSLFTETLLKREETSKQAFDKLLYGDAPTVSLLLGASAVEYWTNATAVSWVDEVLIGLASGALNKDKSGQTQCHCRINWKQTKFLSGVVATGPLKVDPEALAGVIFKVYLDIFEHENPMKLLSISQSSMAQLIRNTAYTSFHRGTIVALMRYLKLRLSVSDYDTTVKAFLEKFSFERSLMFTGNLRLDLSSQMHTQGLLTEAWFSRDIKPNRNLGGFDSWESIPEVVAVSLVVPRQAVMRMFTGSDHAKKASPTIRGSLVSGKDADHKWHNFFDDVQLVWGTIKSSGDRETNQFSVTVEADPAGWSGDSPLIASFYVPASSLQVERKTSFVRLEVQSSAQNIALYQRTLGEELKIYEAMLKEESSVFITKYLPGQSRYAATCEAAGAVAESASETKDTKAIFTADVNEAQDKVVTITGHLDFISDKAKKLLTDKLPLVLEQDSPFTINLVFGNKQHIYPLTFPAPVDASKAKTRIARKSAYVEVIVPFAALANDPHTQTPLTDFVYPNVLAKSLSNTPADLNTPHFNLDRLPIIDVTNTAANRWMTTLLSFMFTVREKEVRAQAQAGRGGGISNSNRSNFKESLFSMFMLSTGLQGGQTGLFGLNQPDGSGMHMLIFVSAVRLDAASGSIVLDAAVIPFTLDLVYKLRPFLQFLLTMEVCNINVNDAELVFWRKMLPSLAERSRTWNHKSSCEYKKVGTAPLSLKQGEPTLCSCGEGKLPDDFVAIPDWDTVSKHATRIAISPTFAVPFVDDCVDFESWERSDPSGAVERATQERCRSCGKTSEQAGAALKKCTRCKAVKYCSGECQKQDWRKHRGECQ